MQELESLFGLVWAGLLGAPVLALATFIFLRRYGRQSLALIAAAGTLLFFCLMVFSGLSFVSVSANFACFVVAYFAYSFLAVSCLGIPRKLVRIPAFVVAIIPMGFGYLLSTIGLLGLAFIVGDYTRPPKRVEQMEDGLACRTTGWG